MTLSIRAVMIGAGIGAEDGGEADIEVKLIPIALWANRGLSEVRAWLARGR